MDLIKELKRIAKKRGAEVIEHKDGHFQVKGPLLVNWWPHSKKKTAYVAGTSGGKSGVRDPSQVVAMAFKPPKLQGEKIKRSSGRGHRAKKRLWKAGKRQCCWCGVDLTKDPNLPNSWSLEHVIPLYLGGLDNANNYDLACVNCNKERGNRMPELKQPMLKKTLDNAD